MSSAAAASCTIRKAARWAGAQCALNSASIASCEPACASRTQARSRRCDGRPSAAGPSRATATSITDALARAEVILAPPPSTGKRPREVHPVSSTQMQDPRPTWTPAGQGERYEPLPGFLKLPVRGWRKLSPRGKRVVAALAGVLVAGIAIAWPFVVRDRNAGRARASGDRRPAQGRVTGRAAGGPAPAPRSAHGQPARPRHGQTAGCRRLRGRAWSATQLEASISADVRERIAAGKLEGHVRGTSCDAVKVRSRTGADFNCFTFTGRGLGLPLQRPRPAAGRHARLVQGEPEAAPPDQLRADGADLARVPLGQLRLGLGQVRGVLTLRTSAAGSATRTGSSASTVRVAGRPAARRGARRARRARTARGPAGGPRRPSPPPPASSPPRPAGCGRHPRSRTACRRRRPAPARPPWPARARCRSAGDAARRAPPSARCRAGRAAACRPCRPPPRARRRRPAPRRGRRRAACPASGAAAFEPAPSRLPEPPASNAPITRGQASEALGSRLVGLGAFIGVGRSLETALQRVERAERLGYESA